VLQNDANGTDRDARRETPALPDDPSRSQLRSIDPSVRQPAPSGDLTSLRVPQTGGQQSGDVSGIQAAVSVDGQGRTIIARGPDAAVSGEVGPDPVPRQVAIEITKALEQDQTSIRIRLDPPELGEVDIQLEFHDLRLKASLSAERSDTLDLLQRDSRTLVRALRDAGLELASSDLSFAHHGRNDDRAARTYAQRAIGLTVSPAAAASLQDLSLMPARRDGFVSLHERRMDLRV
jgi:hypothetical protein